MSPAGSNHPGPLRLGAAFAAIYLCWGATFLAIRYLVADFPPLLGFALRCGGGAACFYLWLAATRGPLGATRAEWRSAATSGTLLFLGCHGLLAWAEQRVSSGEAALFLTSIPLWLTALDAMRRRSRPPVVVLVALGLGVSGIALLALTGGQGSSASVAERVGLIVSGLCWALGTLVSRAGPRAASVPLNTAMQLTAGAVVLLAASGITGEMRHLALADVSPRAWAALGFLILGGTVVGFGAYNWLLGVVSPAAVGTYAFVNPLVALALAWAFGDGEPGLETLVAGLLVTAAVGLIWWASTHSTARGTVGVSAPRPMSDRPPASRISV